MEILMEILEIHISLSEKIKPWAQKSEWELLETILLGNAYSFQKE